MTKSEDVNIFLETLQILWAFKSWKLCLFSFVWSTRTWKRVLERLRAQEEEARTQEDLYRSENLDTEVDEEDPEDEVKRAWYDYTDAELRDALTLLRSRQPTKSS